MKNLRIFWILCLLVAITGCAAVACAQRNTRRPYRFLIPKAYVGWVKVEFNIKGAPALPIEGGHYIFTIPNSGLLQTSSDEEFGLADDEYFYVSSSARQRLVADTDIILNAITMVWSGYSGSFLTTNSADKPLKYIYFFVGPKQEFEKYQCKRARECLDPDENGDPKIGNKKLNN
jgi:hypothetical protein